VDVVNVDALASRIATEAEPIVRRHWLDDYQTSTSHDQPGTCVWAALSIG
jgi:hypothetical protein